MQQLTYHVHDVVELVPTVLDDSQLLEVDVDQRDVGLQPLVHRGYLLPQQERQRLIGDQLYHLLGRFVILLQALENQQIFSQGRLRQFLEKRVNEK